MVPKDLQNILKATKHDNLFALANFGEKDAEELVLFMRETLHLLIAEEEKEEYYGIFKKAPEKYSLLGHVKTLAAMSTIAKRLIGDTKKGGGGKHHVKTGPVIPEEKTGPVIPEDSTEALNAEILKQKKLLEQSVVSHLKENFSSLLNEEYTLNAITVPDGLGSFVAQLPCPVKDCKKLTKVARTNNRWNSSNFYAHLKTHCDPASKKRKAEGPPLALFLKKSAPGEPFKDANGNETTEKRPNTVVADSDDEIIAPIRRRPNAVFADSGDESIEADRSQDQGELTSTICDTFVPHSRCSDYPSDRYSRQERGRRKLEDAAVTCHKITEYCSDFPLLNEVDILREESRRLRSQVVDLMEKSVKKPEPPNHNYPFLHELVQTAMDNVGKLSHGYRYEDNFKEVSALIYLLAGLQGYVFLSRILPFPSVLTARRYLYEKNLIDEGEFRFGELKEFLLSRHLPLDVVVCEDATRVTGRIQYHHKTNQIVGFTLPLDENGVPIVRSFPATTAQKIAEFFEKEETSNYAYTYMVQPLSPSAPSFCLAIFGTNNKFVAANIAKRWKWLKEKALDFGIQVHGFSSDGDPRLLKTMKYRVFSPSASPEWDWFQSPKDKEEICIQDHVHVATKMKSRLCKGSIILPFGKNHVASRGHLVELIASVSKDQHQLTLSDIDSKDKMNFSAVQKLSDPRIPPLLGEHVSQSQATAAYLAMIDGVLRAFMDTKLMPLERVELIMEKTFFLRIWREWLLQEDGYSLQHNFVSSNTYTCVELNAHGLIHFIVKLRESGKPRQFLPWLVSSQPCESTFRAFRSTSTTHCGVVNFSILELQNRIRRIEFLCAAHLKLEKENVFYRHHKAFKPLNEEVFIPETLPSDEEIEETVKSALQKAVDLAKTFGMIKCPSPAYLPICSVKPVSEADIFNNEETSKRGAEEDFEEQGEDEIDAGIIDVDDENVQEFLDQDLPDDENGQEDDVSDDLENLPVVSTGALGVRSSEMSNVPEDSVWVRVRDGNGKAATIKKSTLCWLLSSGHTKLSGDRLERVRTADVSHQKNSQLPAHQSGPSREDFVSVGEWCAFWSEEHSVVVGRIMAFSYLSGSTWRDQEFSLWSAPTSPPRRNARGLGCLCSWFTIKKNGILSPVSMDVHGYYSLSHYICTLPRPQKANHVYTLTCSVKDIRTVSTSDGKMKLKASSCIVKSH